MSWFRNAKFQNKFFAAFGILVFFVVIVAVIANIAINSVEASFVRLSEGPSKRLLYASDTIAEFANCRRSILAMSYMPENESYIKYYYEQYEDSAEKIIAHLDAYYDNYTSDPFLPDNDKDSRTALIAWVKDAFNGLYRANAEKLYAAALEGDVQRMNDLVAVTMPLGNEISDALWSLREIVQEHQDRIAYETHVKSRGASRLLVVFATFSVIISVVVSLLMSSALKKPIVEMQAAMSQIAKGNLSYPIRSDSKDELGMLSNHIGDMVDTISMLNKAVAIVDNVDELIFVTDLEYNLIYMNAKITELHGVDKEECIGKKCYKILGDEREASGGPCDCCPVPELLPIKESLPIQRWERQVKINGRDMWFDCRSNIIRWVDGSLVHIFTSKDNTMNKLHEERQRRHEEELREAALLAQEASRAKSIFLASMSHEIRTPMNAVMGMSELILRKELPQDIYENALGIKSASQNLLAIINDILDFSKIESGMMEIIEEEYLLSSLLGDIIGIIRIKLVEKPIEFVVYVDPEIPSRLVGDETRIRQLLINLLGNAVKYTSEGFISLTVTGSVDDGVATLNMDITDSGIGIKEEDIGKLFDDFVQIDVTKNKGIEGTGLGLTISRRLCQAMGGDITVSSSYGEGSTFSVTLPQQVASREPFARVEDRESKSVLLYEARKLYRDSIIRAFEALDIQYASADNIPDFFSQLEDYPYIFVSSFMYDSVGPAISKLEHPPTPVILSDVSDAMAPSNARLITLPAHSLSIANVLNDVYEEQGVTLVTGVNFTAPDAKVLIVDDITANLLVVEGLMSPYEMRITKCSSGKKAVKLVTENRYDLVFMDHMMPEMDGLEATGKIRQMEGEYFASLPIVALTANAVSGVREMFIQNGMNDFLAKPIEMHKLNAVLEKWIPQEKQKKIHASARPVAQADSEFFELLKTVPELSVDKAVSVMGGAQATYEEIVRLSVSLLPDNLTALDGYLNSDLPRYAIEVHGIKGVLNNIGAFKLGETAYELEKHANSGDYSMCRHLHPVFAASLAEFIDRVTALMDEPEAVEKTQGDRAALSEGLARIEAAVDFFDCVLALEVLAEVTASTYGSETDELLSEMVGAFEIFDFDRAGELIEKLRKEQVSDEQYRL